MCDYVCVISLVIFVRGTQLDVCLFSSMSDDIIWLGSLILSKYLSSCANSGTKSGTNSGTKSGTSSGTKRVFTKAGSEIYKPHKITGLK